MQWKNKFPFESRKQCDFCGAISFQEVVAYDDLRIVRCPCGYVFMDPFLSEEGSKQIFSQSLEEIYPWLRRYDLEQYPAGKRPRIIQAYEHALTRIEHDLGRRGRVLDVGCGRGDFLNLAQARGWVAQGIDFDAVSIQKAKKIFHLSVEEKRLEDLSSLGDLYDVITMWDYFEHVERPLAVLRTAKDRLVPGGILLIACPNYGGLIFRLANFLYKISGGRWDSFLNPIYPPTHLSYYSPDFLAKAAEREGMRIVGVDYDETDLTRVDLHPVLKFLTGLLFGLARCCRASNRFMIFLKK